MSHIATFRKKQYALSGEPDSSDEDVNTNTNIMGNDLVFVDGDAKSDEDEDHGDGDEVIGDNDAKGIAHISNNGRDGTGMMDGSDDDDDMLLCVGTTSSNPQTSTGPSSAIPPPSPPTSTSVFDQIGASYVPPPRPILPQRTVVEHKPDENNNEDEDEDDEVIVSKYTQLKATDIRNGDLDVSEALKDVGDEEDMLLLDDDDDDDSADDEMARMRLADDLQVASAGMSHEEVLELLEEFSVQKKQEREVKKALRAKLEEQKRFREKLKVKGNNNKREVDPTQASTTPVSPQQSLPPTSSQSTKEEAFLASDPRHGEYLDPGLAAFLADIQQGTSTPATTTSTAPTVQRIQAPPGANPTTTNIKVENTTIASRVTTHQTPKGTSSSTNPPKSTHPQPQQLSVTADDDFYDHDVAEHRMQNQLSELLSEFGANQQRPDTNGGVPSSSSSTASPSRIGVSSSTSMAVGNDFLRERRNSRDLRASKEGNTGAISGAIKKGSHGVFGDGGSGGKSNHNSDSTSPSSKQHQKQNTASSSIAQHFSVARIGPVHNNTTTDSHRQLVPEHVGSVLQITDPRVRDALPVSDQQSPPSRSSAGTGGSRSSTATTIANKAPGGGAPPRAGGSSATTGGRRVGSSRASSSATFERKSSVASSMASAVPLSQQMQIKLEEEQRTQEKQRRQLEADRERRLEKKRQAERDQYGLPPINPPHQQQGGGGIAINNGLSLGPQVQGQGGIGGGSRRSTSETVSVSAMPYHQRQQLAQHEGHPPPPPHHHAKTPTPPTTPQPFVSETSDARRRKSSHGQGAKSTTTTTVGGFSFMKKQ